jgi:hypothetical protein
MLAIHAKGNIVYLAGNITLVRNFKLFECRMINIIFNRKQFLFYLVGYHNSINIKVPVSKTKLYKTTWNCLKELHESNFFFALLQLLQLFRCSELPVFRLKHIYRFQMSLVFLRCQRPRNKGVWSLWGEVRRFLDKWKAILLPCSTSPFLYGNFSYTPIRQ